MHSKDNMIPEICYQLFLHDKRLNYNKLARSNKVVTTGQSRAALFKDAMLLVVIIFPLVEDSFTFISGVEEDRHRELASWLVESFRNCGPVVDYFEG